MGSITTTPDGQGGMEGTGRRIRGIVRDQSSGLADQDMAVTGTTGRQIIGRRGLVRRW